VRGFTIDLLFALEEGSVRTQAICEKTQKPANYVSKYLSNMRKYGLVMKNESFWNLTVLGQDFATYMKYEVLQYNTIRKINERKKKEERNLNETSQPKKLKQVSIQAWLLTSTLDDIEKRVVEVLVDHFNKTGSKFLYFDDYYKAAEFFKATPDQMAEAMKHLKQDKIAYPWRDRSLNAWKIGLYKAWVEALEKREGGA
jgi:hypothetical protein